MVLINLYASLEEYFLAIFIDSLIITFLGTSFLNTNSHIANRNIDLSIGDKDCKIISEFFSISVSILLELDSYNSIRLSK